MATESGDSNEIELAPVKHRKLHRHTMVQRLIVAICLVLALVSLIGSFAVWIGTKKLESLNRASIIVRPAFDPTVSTGGGVAAPGGTIAPGATAAPGATLAGSAAPDATFPQADVGALNFLLTGTDNTTCIDPNSKYYGGIGDRSDMGSRSDAILILRVDPTTSQAAILSFPRDLWVKIGNSSGRINSAWDPNNVQKLIDTIHTNFGLSIDHWVNVDFCAFQALVNAVGGISVPFTYAARDTHTGFEFDGTGCHAMQGDEALAYVRSRHYQYLDPTTNTWKDDPSSDYGRITRQQDFIKRVLQKAIDEGATNPVVANNLINAIIGKVTVDQALTVQQLLDVAGAMRTFDPAKVKQYQIAGVGFLAGSAQVIRPTIDTPNMKAILAVFRGQAKLADAPTQVTDSAANSTSVSAVDTTVASAPSTRAPATTKPSKSSSSTSSSSTSSSTTPTTLPSVSATETQKGIYPTADLTCH